MAKIFIKFNSAVIKEVELDKTEITFGRKPGNDIILDNPTVSGFHGVIRKEGERFFIEDKNSTNGTFLNGRPIKKEGLKSKDQIRVAKYILEFVSDAAEDQPAPAVPSSEEHTESSDEKIEEASAAKPEDAHDKNIEEKKEILRRSLGLPTKTDDAKPEEGAEASGPKEKKALVKIIAGVTDNRSEITLAEPITYIGTSDQALIKIKGFLAPSIAAAITHRPEGYFLKAAKPGYPKVNGNPIKEQILLENGALIEIGNTNMLFMIPDDKPKQPPPKKAP